MSLTVGSSEFPLAPLAHFSHISPIFLLILLGIFLLGGAFFSIAETSMMSLNRFRLTHQVKLKDKHALRMHALLNPPDKLLSLVLLGNTFSNMGAASVATFLILRVTHMESLLVLGNIGLAFLTFLFSEMLPKSLAAMYPEVFARKTITLLWWLSRLMQPVLRFTHALHILFLRVLAIPKLAPGSQDTLDPEELKTLIYEGRLRLSKRNGRMLVQLLNLHNLQVEDVMIPRAEIAGIDVAAPWETIEAELFSAHYACLPLFHTDINDIRGVIRIRDLLPALMRGNLDLPGLLQCTHQAYFVPEGTSLTKQLMQFQKQHYRMGFVVDEYGALQGLITVEDIVEEVVGEFGAEIAPSVVVESTTDQTYLVEGGVSLRWLNRRYGWNFPTTGPKTLNGLIVEYLEEIPECPVCLQIGEYKMEIVQLEDHMAQTVRLYAPVALGAPLGEKESKNEL